jgi:hypothetical protein
MGTPDGDNLTLIAVAALVVLLVTNVAWAFAFYNTVRVLSG